MDSAAVEDAGGACATLLAEQRRVEDGFRRLDAARGARARKAAADDLLDAVELVLALEEQLLHPAVRRTFGEGGECARLAAAGRTARQVLRELRASGGEARFATLSSFLARRFDDERAALFPLLSRSALDRGRLAGDMREFKARHEQARAGGLYRRCLAAAGALFP